MNDFWQPVQHLLQELKDGSCVSKLTNIQWDIDQESKMWQTYYHDPLQKIQESSRFTTESAKDEKIKEAIKSLETNRWNKSSPFYKIKDELTTLKNTLLKSNCIVIPQTLIQKTLEIPHNQHQAISKTKAWLREKVWWPGLSADTEYYIKSCYACQVTTPSTVKCEPQKWVRFPKYLGTP